MRTSLHTLAIVGLLATIAIMSPAPRHTTDAGTYERLSEEWLIPHCDDIHCFRVLVPWIVGILPGAAIVKWKAVAVVLEAGAAWFMRRWVLAFGGSEASATQVMWLTALGSGSLYTLFDPHTADPLMHLLGPWLMLLLIRSRATAATIVACIGILAKEFAVVPLFVAGLLRFQQGRFADMRRAWLGGLLAALLWLGWQTFLRQVYDYGDGSNQSFKLLQGAFFLFWVRSLSPSLVVATLTMALGVLWILWGAGLYWGRREISQLTFAALPCILGLCYVQQPDRALWNFAFVVMPAAAVVLARVPSSVGWSLVALHGLANLRVGAQLTFVPSAKFALAAATALTLGALWQSARTPARQLSPT